MQRRWATTYFSAAALSCIPTSAAWSPPSQMTHPPVITAGWNFSSKLAGSLVYSADITPSRGSFRRNLSSSSVSNGETPDFRRGDKIQVEVISFGPMGASVDVVGRGHAEDDLIPETDPPLARGLVLQREIKYFRESRDSVDVVRGEVLPAYVETVRDDGRLDISLRVPGGKAKADQVGQMILERLEWDPSGMLQVGDKSSPDAIAQEFPGVSKGTFKKAVSALYKKGLVQPGPESVKLLKPS